MSKKVYLAGPITGLTYDECTGWRDTVDNELKFFGIQCMSPMRGKRYLNKKEEKIGDVPRLDIHKVGRGMSSQEAITARDRRDVMEADLLFVNVLNAKEASPGTLIEIGWADMNRTPILMVMEKEGNPHDRSLVRGCVDFRAYSVNEGIDIVKAFFDY